MKAKRIKTGDVITIEFDPGSFGVGRIVEGEFIEFYDLKLTKDQLDKVDQLIKGAKVLFTLSVHKSWKKSDKWEIVGSDPAHISPIPFQFMQNIADPNDITLVDSNGNARKATFDEVQHVERLAVWEDNHVEDRLRDHYNNKPNTWYEMLRPKKPV